MVAMAQDDSAAMTWETYGEGASFTAEGGVTQDIALSTDDDGLVYTIYTARGLAWVAYATNYGLISKEVVNAPERQGFVDCTLKLSADINLSQTPEGITDFSTQWSPIGCSVNNAFCGTFDGDGHTISGLSVTDEYFAGLFGYVASGGSTAPVIKNLTVAGVDVCGVIAGGVAGYCDGATITNCTTLESKIYTLAHSEIDPAYESMNQSVGGIAGYMINGIVENSQSSGSVTKGNYAGGIVGLTETSQVLSSHSSAYVSATNAAGGIQGAMIGGTLMSCYALGPIESQGYAGGICGSVADKNADFTATIQNCVALNIGGISGTTASGRIIGVIVNNENQYIHSNYASILIGEQKSSILDGTDCRYNQLISLCGKDAVQPAYQYIGGGEITISAGANTTVSLVDKTGDNPTAAYGETVLLNVVVGEGYKIKSIDGKTTDGDETFFVSQSGDNYSFEMPAKAVTITSEAEEAFKSFVVDGVKYKTIENTTNEVAIIGKDGSATALTFPESVPSPDNNELNFAVTQIADNAFENDSEITSVEIPASIASIGTKAFSGCSKLEDIIFTGTVPPTIGEGAFCKISTDATITVPVQSIDAYKAALGDALASKVIGDQAVITVAQNIQGGRIDVFVVNGDTETLQTPADGKVLVDWGTQVKIEAVAIDGFGISWLKIDGEKVIGDTYTVSEIRYDITAEAEFYYKIATTIDKGGNESVTIKGSIDTTGDTQTVVVTHCDKGSESATIPDYAESIGGNIPVTSIAASAFEGCSSLKTVEIPSSITTIGSDAFKGCTSLEKFKIKKTTTAMPYASATRAAARAAADDVEVPEVDEHAFDDIVDKATLYVPEGWKEAFKADSEWGKFSKIKEYLDDENETVLAELTLTASAGGKLVASEVTSSDGTPTLKVAENSDVEVSIMADAGYQLQSLTLNGIDVMSSLANGKLTISSLEGENTLVAVFSTPTGIHSIESSGKVVLHDLFGRKVSSPSRGLYIKNNKKVIIK